MRKKKRYLSGLKSILKKKVFDAQNKWNTNVWSLDLAPEIRIQIFEKKIMLGQYVVIFFLVLLKDVQRRVLQVGQNWNWETSFWNTKNLKNTAIFVVVCSFHGRIADIKVAES